MNLRKELHQENRRSWNAATRAHNSHKSDQAAFLREGGTTLFSEERELLGDVAQQKVAHLLCNAGQDTLSIAALGAEVTGVDISDEAIEFATRLSTESGLSGRFIRSDVYDYLAATTDTFDVVFNSYGAMGWLSDLPLYFQGVRRILKPGGRLVMVEFHPVAYMFEEDLSRKWNYSANEPDLISEGVPDYVAASPGLVPMQFEEGVEAFENEAPCHFFPFGIGDILQGVLASGMRLTSFQEFDYANGCRFFDVLELGDDRRLRWPDGHLTFPLMFALTATV